METKKSWAIYFGVLKIIFIGMAVACEKALVIMISVFQYSLGKVLLGIPCGLQE